MNNKRNPHLKEFSQTLRREMTKEERHLWYDFLKTLPITVHRQKVFTRYIADFYIAEKNMVIELDGSQHYEDEGKCSDRARDEFFASQGIKVLRYSNADINQNFDGVCEDILRNLNTSSVCPSGSHLLRGEKALKETSMKTVTIYTDGACSGNPGPGGWGAILMYGPHKKEMSGGEKMTTNNRMELMGVISALQALKEPCIVELWSDSKYVIDALSKGWAVSWRSKGWRKADKKPALNVDLWEVLLALTEKHEMRYHWVKGHAENPYNNRCDELAVMEREKFAI